jgi:hypothetical protein
LYSALPPSQQAEAIYWQYREAKRTWRKFSGKPPRRARWGVKKGFGKGHSGKGQGKTSPPAFATMIDAAAYFKGRGKGTPGQRTNPRGKDGKIMTCSICNSENHFRARCPRNPQRQQVAGFASFPSSSTQPLAVQPSPLAGIAESTEHLSFIVSANPGRPDRAARTAPLEPRVIPPPPGLSLFDTAPAVPPLSASPQPPAVSAAAAGISSYDPSAGPGVEWWRLSRPPTAPALPFTAQALPFSASASSSASAAPVPARWCTPSTCLYGHSHATMV